MQYYEKLAQAQSHGEAITPLILQTIFTQVGVTPQHSSESEVGNPCSLFLICCPDPDLTGATDHPEGLG